MRGGVARVCSWGLLLGEGMRPPRWEKMVSAWLFTGMTGAYPGKVSTKLDRHEDGLIF